MSDSVIAKAHGMTGRYEDCRTTLEVCRLSRGHAQSAQHRAEYEHRPEQWKTARILRETVAQPPASFANRRWLTDLYRGSHSIRQCRESNSEYSNSGCVETTRFRRAKA